MESKTWRSNATWNKAIGSEPFHEDDGAGKWLNKSEWKKLKGIW